MARRSNLAFQIIDPMVEEILSAFNAYYGEEFVFLKDDFIIIHFPSKRVTVNRDQTKFTDITDLYVKLLFSKRSDGITIDRIQGDVGSYSALQYHNNYRHSHLHSGTDNGFDDFCLGSSELSALKSNSRTNRYDYDTFYLMANMIDIFMDCEGPGPFTTTTRANQMPGGSASLPTITLQEATRVILDMGFIPDFSYARGNEIISPCISEDYLFEFAKRLPNHFLGTYDPDKGYAEEHVHQNNNDAFLIGLWNGNTGRTISFKNQSRPVVVYPPILSGASADEKIMLDYPTPRTVSVIRAAVSGIYHLNLKKIQPKITTLNVYSDAYKKANPITDKLILNHILNKYK